MVVYRRDTIVGMEEITRRGFVAATAAAAFTARSYASVKGANDRLNIGIIGCGGQATEGHMHALLRNKEADNVQVTAVCDIYEKRLKHAAELTGARSYREYPELLANREI